MNKGFLRLRKSVLTILCCLALVGGSVSPLLVYADTTEETGEVEIPSEASEIESEVEATPQAETDSEEENASDEEADSEEENVSDEETDSEKADDAAEETEPEVDDDADEANDVSDADSSETVDETDTKVEPAEEPKTPKKIRDQSNASELQAANNMLLDDRTASVQRVANAASLPENALPTDEVEQGAQEMEDEIAAYEEEHRITGSPMRVSGVVIQDGNFKYTLTTNDDGTCSITGIAVADTDQDASSLVIPETLTVGEESYSVTSITAANPILPNAVKSVTLPETMSDLSKSSPYLFYKCNYLEEVTLPESVTTIPASTFYKCAALRKVTAKGEVDTIRGYAFYQCSKLTSYTQKGSPSEIGKYAFYYCSSMTTVPDLSELSTLGEAAFYNCQKMSGNVDLSSLKTIPDFAFTYDSKIKITAFSDELVSIGQQGLAWTTIDAAFPDSLTSIGDYGCYNSKFPATVTLPDSLTSLGKGVFTSASGVKNLYIGEEWTELSTLDDNAFGGNLDNVVIAKTEDQFTYTGSNEDNIHYLYEDGYTHLTLQERVNKAADGTGDAVVTLRKSYQLSQPLNVPAGKAVTIQSAEGKNYTITGTSGQKLENLITVQEGADVTFKNVRLYGGVNTSQVVQKSLVYSQGKVTLGEGTVLGGDADNSSSMFEVNTSNSGAILASGSDAELIVNGADIKYIWVKSGSNSAPIHATNGAKVTIKSGDIHDNWMSVESEYESSGGVLIDGGASGTMSGGTIRDNHGLRGAAITVLGDTTQSSFELSGGTISGNVSTGSGAVYVADNAKFTMNDGTIDGNTGTIGGGISVYDSKLHHGGGEYRTEFTMNGGTISNNKADKGGGIYTCSNGTVLNAGTISGNEVTDLGGGIYAEGQESFYSTAKLYNAYVSNNHAVDKNNNTASGIGGGLWLCATGSATVYISDGGMIADNSADRAANDVASKGGGEDYSLTLSNRVLGGGKVKWNPDGKLYNDSNDWNPHADGTDRYPNGKKPVIVEDNGEHQSLHAVISDADKAKAHDKARLFVTNNTAPRGGGIAANGGLEIGKSKPIKITVNKKWITDDGRKQTDSVKVQLYRDGVAYRDPVTLNKENNWTYTWEDLESGYDYTIKEVKVPENFTVKVTSTKDEETGNITFTVTNDDKPDTPGGGDEGGDDGGDGGNDGGGDNPPPVTPPTPPKETPPEEDSSEDVPEEPTEETPAIEDKGERVEGNENWGYYDENGNWHFYDEAGFIAQTGDDSLIVIYTMIATMSLVVLAASARKRIR